MPTRRPIYFALLIFLIATSFASAQQSQTSALINQALDKPVALDLNVTLPDAIRTIGQKTGVPIDAPPEVWNALPWGNQTSITIKIANTTLRDALSIITRTLGLTFEVRDENVELEPMPALERLGRRATQEELAALNLLASTPANLSNDRPTVRQLIEQIDQRLVETKVPFAIESRPGDNVLMDQPIFVARNATVMDALEALPQSTRATWYPWGKSILIVPKEDQVRNLLSRPITVRYPGTDVAQVLTELSQKSGVPFEIEPGAIQRIPPDARRIKLELYDASISKALEAIAGVSGLGYVANEKGVYIWNANPGTASGRDPIVGMIPMQDGMQLLVPQSQVPADMQEYLRARMRTELEKIRSQMNADGFKPTTTPATKPATLPNEDL